MTGASITGTEVVDAKNIECSTSGDRLTLLTKWTEIYERVYPTEEAVKEATFFVDEILLKSTARESDLAIVCEECKYALITVGNWMREKFFGKCQTRESNENGGASGSKEGERRSSEGVVKSGVGEYLAGMGHCKEE